jgi:hypothetical protein
MPNRKRPVGCNKLDFWLEPNVNVVLLEGGISRFGRLIQTGKIVAAATYKMNIPEAAYTNAPPRDLENAFSMRFVLITPENLDQYKPYFRF